MKTKETLSAIMTAAWRMFKVTVEAFSVCLKKAWTLFKLRKAMTTGIVQFHFAKISGEVRQAFGTLQAEYTEGKVKGAERKQNDLLFTYWDTEADGFRCFKNYNIISIG
ncbi:hypothetical protein Barb4_01176 [Bacteroidales bacterium Barb4]|nr:hypothetical protein Barb4_01176 [Bacteroidales bacterium Barb4]